MDLFTHSLQNELSHTAPLADRMRPRDFDDFLGQEDVIGPASPLRQAITRDSVPSLILWGPPGVGKTTLARMIAAKTKSTFIPFSATSSGTADLKREIAEAQKRRSLYGERTIIFIDEIHRWNKSQQDALLPHVESGIITLIGATTENPSFEVNAALLSRCRVFMLHELTAEALAAIIDRSLHDEIAGLGATRATITDDAKSWLIAVANGDARIALNALEFSAASVASDRVITRDIIESAVQKSLRYDKAGEEHYGVISAFHKSMRGGDADASLYWLGRMLEAGEDPLYVARRIIRFASEDIGLADPQALVIAVAAYHAAHAIGMPECTVNLAQAAVYCARAKKSNALYTAYGAVAHDIHTLPQEPVPLHLRNAPTTLMKEVGYGKGYKYTPNYDNPDDGKQEYLPESLKGKRYLEGI